MSMESCSSGRKLKTSDSFNGQRHQHHIPRLSSTNPRSIMNSEITHPCSCIQNTKLFPFRPPLANATGNITKREFKEEVSFASNSRWNPKPEQLQALEDMYQRGTRAPSAEQIQQIAAYLRRFGKIEGKNVFYWFQNHKARERQKRRRCQTDQTNGEQLQSPSQIVQTKDTGLLKRTCFDEVEETNNWAPPSYCSKLSEESVSIRREAAAGRADGWIQCEEREIQQRHATWKMMELSYSPSFHFVNAMTATREAFTINQENESIESQTLQLFPLGSDDNNLTEKEYPKTPMTSTIINTDSAPNQFFEFLPLKN